MRVALIPQEPSNKIKATICVILTLFRRLTMARRPPLGSDTTRRHCSTMLQKRTKAANSGKKHKQGRRWQSLSFNQCDMTISISRRCGPLIPPSLSFEARSTHENEKWSGKPSRPNLSSSSSLLVRFSQRQPFVGLVIHHRGIPL